MSFLRNVFSNKHSHPQVEYKERETTDGNTYEIYVAPNKSVALSFLRETEVKEERKYVVVETPEGSFGKDMIMVFDEQTSEKIELGERKPLPKLRKSETHCARCGYPVLPAGRPPYSTIELILLDELKEHGVGFYCSDCRTAWCPFCVEQKRPDICPLCNERMDMVRED